MRGYWGLPDMHCRCCRSGPKEKFWCRPCDHVVKAPLGWDPVCPFCRELMENMGHRWRPGRKGKRRPLPVQGGGLLPRRKPGKGAWT